MKDLSLFLTENIKPTYDDTLNEGLASIFKKLWNWASRPFSIEGRYENALKKRYSLLVKQRKIIRKQLNGLAAGSVVGIQYGDGTDAIKNFVKGSRSALNAAKPKVMLFMVGDAISTIKNTDFACNPVTGHEVDGMGFFQFLNAKNDHYGNPQLVRCEIAPVALRSDQTLKITSSSIPGLSGKERDYYPLIPMSDVIAISTADKYSKILEDALIEYVAKYRINDEENNVTGDILFESYSNKKLNEVFNRLFRLLGYDDMSDVVKLVNKKVQELTSTTDPDEEPYEEPYEEPSKPKAKKEPKKELKNEPADKLSGKVAEVEDALNVFIDRNELDTTLGVIEYIRTLVSPEEWNQIWKTATENILSTTDTPELRDLLSKVNK